MVVTEKKREKKNRCPQMPTRSNKGRERRMEGSCDIKGIWTISSIFIRSQHWR